MLENNQNPDQVSRRSMLRTGVGATGTAIGLGGLSQIVSATETSDTDLQELEELPQVKSILDELGYNTFPDGVEAETFKLEADSVDASLTSVDFEYGTLQVGRAEDILTVVFSFDEESSNADSWLEGSKSGTTFYRMATSDEQHSVLSRLSLDGSDNVTVYTTGDIEGFFVNIIDPTEDQIDKIDEDHDNLSTTDNINTIQFKVTSSNEKIESITTNEIYPEAGAVSPAGIVPNPRKAAARQIAKGLAKSLGWTSIDQVDDTCGSKIGSCLDGILATLDCAKCGPICVSSTSGIGAVLCFLCILATCSNALSTKNCALAVDCVQ